MKQLKHLFLGGIILLSCFIVESSYGQDVISNRDIFKAKQLPSPNQYRSSNGAPGPDYWQNRADYDIEVSLYPDAHKIEGKETITYTNNSEQDLNFLWLQLDQNLFKPTSIGARMRGRVRDKENKDKSGFKISGVKVIRDGEARSVDFTIKDASMRIELEDELDAEGGKIQIRLNFSFIIPQSGAGRMGRLDVSQGTIYELAQWYPRMYVYDDVHGWNVMPYQGMGEFYLEYGTFDVEINVPYDYIVAAAGTLENKEEVLTEDQLRAFAQAKKSTETVTIISAEEVGKPSTRPTSEGWLTWKYHAENVRDFAWAASAAFIWDAASTITHDGEPTLAQSFYPVESIAEGDAVGWEHSTQMVQHTIEFYSRWLYPYPYPVAINVAGITGGMEYPMIVFCSWQARGTGLFGVTDHEFGHEWFPMIVGSDERRHVWMDEGLNTFINDYSWLEYYHEAPEGMNLEDVAKYRSVDALLRDNAEKTANRLLYFADDQPIATITERIKRGTLGYLGYRKPGAGLVLLREYILGEELFDSAFREYIDRWAYKHPQPADFFRTMENISGENLDWFWNGWFNTTSLLNPKIDSVALNDAERTTLVYINQAGDMIMPLEVLITFDDGQTEVYTIPEEAFYTDDLYTLKIKGFASRVELDPQSVLPDVDDAGSVWTLKKGLQGKSSKE